MEAWEKYFGSMRPTVGLMMMMKMNLQETGNVIVMGSEFCMGKGIIEIQKHGINGQNWASLFSQGDSCNDSPLFGRKKCILSNFQM